MDKAYKSLKMSDEKKRELVKMLKEQDFGKQPFKNQKSFTWVVMPLFVILAMAFTVLSMKGNGTITTGTDIPLFETNHFQFTKELLIWWSVSLVLLMIAYVEFLLLSKKPGRLIEYALFRFAHNALGTWKAMSIFLTPLVLLIGETAIIFIFTNMELQTFFVVLHLLFAIMLMQLTLVKDCKAATCPHCGEVLSKKVLILNFGCQSCGKGRHKKVDNRSKEFFATGGWLIILLFPLFNIVTIWHALFFGITYLIFTLNFIMPYIVEFSKDDEPPPPLW